MYQMFRSQFLAFSIYQSKNLTCLFVTVGVGFKVSKDNVFLGHNQNIFVDLFRLGLGCDVIYSNLYPEFNLLIGCIQVCVFGGTISHQINVFSHHPKHEVVQPPKSSSNVVLCCLQQPLQFTGFLLTLFKCGHTLGRMGRSAMCCQSVLHHQQQTAAVGDKGELLLHVYLCALMPTVFATKTNESVKKL